MSDEMTFTLHNPLTEEEWDMITDVDLDHTSEITFHTKHGKEVVFVKRKLPPAQPEPAIPLQWIEAQIEWLKSLDNAFSTLTAGQISAMVNKWKDEQDGRHDQQVGGD